METIGLIHRRLFLARAASSATLLCTTSELSAQRYDEPQEMFVIRFAQTIHGALSDNDRQAARALAMESGWLGQTLPRLSSLKTQIAAEHRGGQSRLVKGMRFSDSEIAWSVTLVESRSAT